MSDHSHNSKHSARTLTVKLNDVQDLFAPRYDPFHSDYHPQSGMEQIALFLKIGRLTQGLHVTFVLPSNAPQSKDLQQEIQDAITRYSEFRVHNQSYELRARQQSIIRSLQVGFLILGLSLALAAAVSNSEHLASWLRNLLSNSITILGSVALWSPADAFLYGTRPLMRDIQTYRAIRHMTFDIQYTGAPVPATTANP